MSQCHLHNMCKYSGKNKIEITIFYERTFFQCVSEVLAGLALFLEKNKQIKKFNKV